MPVRNVLFRVSVAAGLAVVAAAVPSCSGPCDPAAESCVGAAGGNGDAPSGGDAMGGAGGGGGTGGTVAPGDRDGLPGSDADAIDSDNDGVPDSIDLCTGDDASDDRDA